MSIIRAGDSNIALINIFTVDPAKADELIAVLNDATEKAMKDRPGFISAAFHRSLDGRRVANYAQWRSKEDFEAMMADPEAHVHMDAAAGLVESYEPALYEVRSVHEA